MNANLNQIYELLRIVADPCPDATIDKNELATESREANSELARDIELLREAYAELFESFQNGDLYEQRLALAILRSRAMNLETVFGNLARSVESIVFALRKIE